MNVINRDPHHFSTVVGRNVRHVRQSRGMTIQQLSDQLEKLGHRLSPAAISMMERSCIVSTTSTIFKNSRDSRIVISIDRLMYLADALGVTYLRLLTEDLCDD